MTMRAGVLTFLYALTLFTSRASSECMAMAGTEGDLDLQTSDRRWTSLEHEPGTSIWSDAFSNMLRL